ncbi:hypothetical protein L1987_79541 [Smallanthus sonchifolius]|uniref:Uncharacterized protein n=1 Tax=Smallanthus sonchifolius TaxID=185202 RepID=A0ACB8ZFX6_9ASTR|nr:hypothetical protein L1987_79541 [Smallanthus sonchifolius]
MIIPATTFFRTTHCYQSPIATGQQLITTSPHHNRRTPLITLSLTPSFSLHITNERGRRRVFEYEGGDKGVSWSVVASSTVSRNAMSRNKAHECRCPGMDASVTARSEQEMKLKDLNGEQEFALLVWGNDNRSFLFVQIPHKVCIVCTLEIWIHEFPSESLKGRALDGKNGWRVELSRNSNGGRGSADHLKCYQCGETGHFARDYRSRGRRRSPSPRRRRSPSYGSR